MLALLVVLAVVRVIALREPYLAAQVHRVKVLLAVMQYTLALETQAVVEVVALALLVEMQL
jgi:hypothetical protein